MLYQLVFQRVLVSFSVAVTKETITGNNLGQLEGFISSYRLQCIMEGRPGRDDRKELDTHCGGTLSTGLLSGSYVALSLLSRAGPSCISYLPRECPTDMPTGISSVEVTSFQVYQVDN